MIWHAVEELEHKSDMNGRYNIIILNLFLEELTRFIMVDKVVLVKDILVGEDEEHIQILNLAEVLVEEEVVLVDKVMMPQVQIMETPMDIPIQHMGHHFFVLMVVMVDLVELSLCLELLI